MARELIILPRFKRDYRRARQYPEFDKETLEHVFDLLIAGEIIKRMDKDSLSTRAAHAKTGIAAADLSHIRKADLSRFTVDRLMTVINLLGARIDVAVKVRMPHAT